MMRCLLLAIFIVSINPLEAQVYSGNTAGLILSEPSGSKTVTVASPPFGQLDNERSDSIDLDRDGRADLLLLTTACNTIDCEGGHAMIHSLNPHLSWMVDSALFPLHLTEATRIDSNHLWQTADYSILSARFYGIGGLTVLGNWPTLNTPGYAGFKLLSGTDTLYGWLELQVSINNAFVVLKANRWAITNPPTAPPYVLISVDPEKTTYCAGDVVQINAYLLDADTFHWLLPDSTETLQTQFQYFLPAGGAEILFEAANENGMVNGAVSLQTSGLEVVAGDILITCSNPIDSVNVTLNQPATLVWLFQGDTIPAQSVGMFPGTYLVVATDSNGCTDIDEMEVNMDITPPVVSILPTTLPNGQTVLIAQGNPDDVLFFWTSSLLPDTVYADTLFYSSAGEYTLHGIGENGCENTVTITGFLETGTPENTAPIQLMPNPANASVMINHTGGIPVTAQLIDVFGQLHLDEQLFQANEVKQICLKNLSPGIYWIRISDIRGHTYAPRPLIIFK